MRASGSLFFPVAGILLALGIASGAGATSPPPSDSPPGPELGTTPTTYAPPQGESVAAPASEADDPAAVEIGSPSGGDPQAAAGVDGLELHAGIETAPAVWARDDAREDSLVQAEFAYDVRRVTDDVVVRQLADAGDEVLPEELAGQALPTINGLLDELSQRVVAVDSAAFAPVSFAPRPPASWAKSKTQPEGLSAQDQGPSEKPVEVRGSRLPRDPTEESMSDLGGPLHLPSSRKAPLRPDTATVQGAALSWATASAALAALGIAFALGPSLMVLRRLWDRICVTLPGLAMFTRISEEGLLSHPRRHEILEFVRQNPGERLEDVRKRLEISNGAMWHHIRILERRQRLSLVADGAFTRLFPYGSRTNGAPYLPPLRRQMLELLSAAPGLTQREMARRLGRSDRVVSYHLGQLRRVGLVLVESRAGRHLCYPSPWPR